MKHILCRGETAEMLSVRYGIPVCMLMRANAGKRPTAGTAMEIPKADFCAEMRRGDRVRAGDTVFKIAERNGVTMYELLQENPRLSPGELTEGMEIRLPPPMKIYTCGAVDTLQSVCEKFGIAEETLRRYNRLEKSLYQGLQLKLPES